MSPGSKKQKQEEKVNKKRNRSPDQSSPERKKPKTKESPETSPEKKETKTKDQPVKTSTSKEPDRSEKSLETNNPNLTLKLKLENAMKKREKDVEENNKKNWLKKKDDLFQPDKPKSDDKEKDPRYSFHKTKIIIIKNLHIILTNLNMLKPYNINNINFFQGKLNSIVSATLATQERLVVDKNWNPPGHASHRYISTTNYFQKACSEKTKQTLSSNQISIQVLDLTLRREITIQTRRRINRYKYTKIKLLFIATNNYQKIQVLLLNKHYG